MIFGFNVSVSWMSDILSDSDAQPLAWLPATQALYDSSFAYFIVLKVSELIDGGGV